MTDASCTHVFDPGDRFCRMCGVPLEQAAEQTSVESGPASTGSLPAVGSGLITGVDPGQAVLVVRRGAGEGASYLLVGDVIVAGRAPDADLFLDDVTVSREHAEFRREGSDWRLRDTQSLNGTYVNRHRVDDRLLEPGDEVQIGKYRFVYLIGGGVAHA